MGGSGRTRLTHWPLPCVPSGPVHPVSDTMATFAAAPSSVPVTRCENWTGQIYAAHGTVHSWSDHNSRPFRPFWHSQHQSPQGSRLLLICRLQYPPMALVFPSFSMEFAFPRYFYHLSRLLRRNLSHNSPSKHFCIIPFTYPSTSP
jgi:hypothetical protein